MANVVISPTRSNPTSSERMANPKSQNNFRMKINRPDYLDILKGHKLQTDIIERIKRADPEKPFYVKITPEIALDLLTLNDDDQNRELRWKAINSYVEQMKSKKWKERNGDTLRITKKLKLIDGQHKLWAIYLSGVSVDYIIVTGLDDDAFSYIDLNERRNAEDMVKIGNFANDSRQIAQTIKLILLYQNRSMVKGSIGDKDVPNYEVNAFVNKKSQMVEVVAHLTRAKTRWMKDSKNFLTAPQWAFMMYILGQLPGMKAEAAQFLDSFASGVELKANDPVKVVRGYFEKEFSHLKNRNRNRSNIVSITTKVKHLIEAWNMRIRREKSETVKVDMDSQIILKPIYRY